LLLSVRGDILSEQGCHSCADAGEDTGDGVLHYHEEWESADLDGKLSGRSGMEYPRALREPDHAPAQP